MLPMQTIQYPLDSPRYRMCVELRHPHTGLAWLDDAIREARRRETAAALFPGLLAAEYDGFSYANPAVAARAAVDHADHLLRELDNT